MPWHSWRRPEAAEAGGGLARGDHTPGVPLASFWREVGDGGGSGWAGPGKWATRWAAQVTSGGFFSLSICLILLCFSISSVVSGLY